MNFAHKTTKKLMIILVLISIALLVRLLYFEYNLLKYPYQWEAREALQLNHAIILSKGKPLYTINEKPPLVHENFGPVNPALVALLLKLFGKNLFAPRLVSFISFLLIQLFIAYVVFSLTHRWKDVFLSIGLNTFMLDFWQWLLICRPDALGNFLLFSTLIIHWKFPYKKIAIVLSLMTGLLAFFTKIPFVSGYGSIILSYWFVHKDKKMALSYLFYSTGLLITAILIMNYLTDGIYFLFTFEMVAPAVLTYSLDFIYWNLRFLLFYYLPIFVLILYVFLRGSLNYERYGVFYIHLLVGLTVSFFLLLNTGGALYYLYIVVPALIIIGCDLIYMESTKSNHKILIPILTAIIFLMIFKAGYRDFIKNEFVIPSSELAKKWEPIEELIMKTNGHVMNSDGTAILNIHAGKGLYTEGLGYEVNRDYLKNKYNYFFIDIKHEIALKNFALIINPAIGIESYVRDYYNLSKTYVVPGNFGKLRTSINIFTPKTNVIQTY